MRTALLLTVTLLAVACSKKKPEDKPVAPTPPAGSGAVTSPATPVTAAPTAGLNCEKVLPQTLRDKYFKGRAVTDVPAVTESNAECKIAADASGDEPTISATCHDNMAAAKDASIAQLKEMFKKDVTDVADIGKGGVMIETGTLKQMSVWDDDSNCSVNVSMSSAIDIRAFTKDLIAHLPPK